MSPDVAFFIPSLTVGGAQRVTISIANGLAERGYAVDLVLSYREGTFLERVSDCVTIVSLDTPRVPVVGIGASIPGLRSYLENRTPAVLFSAMTYASVVSIASGMALDVDTVFVPVEHDTFGIRPGLKERLTSYLAKYLYAFADHVVAVSEGVADSVIAGTTTNASDVSVLYNPVPVAEVRSESRASVDDSWLRSDRFEVILSVGRLESVQKDLPTLLEAFERLNRAREDTRLILAGTGPERQELLALATELGVEEVVSLPGYVENPYSYMQQASAFVLSSRREGLPTVLIEALACGCPVVSTDCPSGPREILAHGTYGALVPVGDERALADAILSTLEDPPDPAELSERADDFSTDVIVEEYVAFLERAPYNLSSQ
jgi:glycosyltransferase involved in cell wall biosynthesis